MLDLAESINGHPFLQDLNARHLKILIECASISDFVPGQFIFRQNEEALHCYLIVDGKVDVELFSADGGPVVLQSLGKGEVLGWSWLIPPYYWRMDARALQPTRAIVLDGVRLRTSMDEDHEFGYEMQKRFLAVVTQRLESARLELLSVYGAHS